MPFRFYNAGSYASGMTNAAWVAETAFGFGLAGSPGSNNGVGNPNGLFLPYPGGRLSGSFGDGYPGVSNDVPVAVNASFPIGFVPTLTDLSVPGSVPMADGAVVSRFTDSTDPINVTIYRTYLRDSSPDIPYQNGNIADMVDLMDVLYSAYGITDDAWAYETTRLSALGLYSGTGQCRTVPIWAVVQNSSQTGTNPESFFGVTGPLLNQAVPSADSGNPPPNTVISWGASPMVLVEKNGVVPPAPNPAIGFARWSPTDPLYGRVAMWQIERPFYLANHTAPITVKRTKPK